MKLRVEDLQERMQYIRDHVESFNTEERATALNKMYDHFEERMMLAPASSTDYFHNCWAGGYIDHVMNITEAGKKLFKLYQDFGFNLSYELDSVIFCTMHHDLGKLGDGTEPYYIPQDSEWHQKNKKEYFTHNPKLQYFDVTDRAFWLLNKYGITYTQKEQLGIMMADGLYNEATKKYWVSYNEDFQLKTDLPYIIHWADNMSTRQENSEYRLKNGMYDKMSGGF